MLKYIIVCLLLAGLAMPFSSSSDSNQIYDVVILNGRVIDPESQLDASRNIGISGGTIKAVTTARLNGRTVIDAKGLVVAPGFIDLH